MFTLRGRISPGVLGILMLMLGLGLLTLQDVFMKPLAERISPMQLLAIRTCFAILVFRAALAFLGVTRPLRTRRTALQLVRGTLLTMALACFYAALSVMELFDVYAIFFTAPIIATALAALFLGERGDWRCWLAILSGFCGALLMVQPSSGVLQTAALICLLAAVLYAITILMTRRLGDSDSAATTAYYTLLCYLAWPLLGAAALEWWLVTGGETAMPWLRGWQPLTLWDLLSLAIAGALTCAGFVCLAFAYRKASVTALAPFEYSGIVWSGLLSWFAWQQTPTSGALLGAAMIVLAGVYIARRPVALPTGTIICAEISALLFGINRCSANFGSCLGVVTRSRCVTYPCAQRDQERKLPHAGMCLGDVSLALRGDRLINNVHSERAPFCRRPKRDEKCAISVLFERVHARAHNLPRVFSGCSFVRPTRPVPDSACMRRHPWRLGAHTWHRASVRRLAAVATLRKLAWHAVAN